MDPLEHRKFELLVRGMLPAPFVYVVVAWIYLAIADQEPFFGKAVAGIGALTVGAAAPLWGLATYKIALRRQRADARLAQTLLGLAHGPAAVALGGRQGLRRLGVPRVRERRRRGALVLAQPVPIGSADDTRNTGQAQHLADRFA